MGVYFDVSNPEHVALILPAEMRKALELATVAEEAEQDILDRYTRTLPVETPGSLASQYTYDPQRPNGYYLYPGATPIDDDQMTWVLLRGYAVDPVDAPARLSLALRRAVAEVTAWRLQRLRRDIAVESQHNVDGKFTRWTAESREKFPPDWDRRLREFDLRPPNYVI